MHWFPVVLKTDKGCKWHSGFTPGKSGFNNLWAVLKETGECSCIPRDISDNDLCMQKAFSAEILSAKGLWTAHFQCHESKMNTTFCSLCHKPLPHTVAGK